MSSKSEARLQQQKQAIMQLVNQGQLVRAGEICGTLCNAFPADVELWQSMGTINGMQGNMAVAEKCFRKVVELQPESGQAWFNVGVAQAAQNRIQEAINSYEIALARDPRHYQASSNLGILYMDRGQPQAAFAYQHVAAELAPDVAEVQYNLGIAYEELFEPHKAIECLEKAVRLNPAFTNARVSIGLIYERLNRREEADRHVLAVLRQEPGNARALLLHARILRRNGQLDEAETCARQALGSHTLSDKDTTRGYQELGLILDKQGRYDEAFAAFRESNRVGETMNINVQGTYLEDVRTIRSWVDSQERITSPLEGTELEPTTEHIFLIGFPRSGTTLLEQVLSAHSKVVTTDERPLLNDVINQVLGPRSGGKPYPAMLAEASQETLQACRQWYLARARDYTGQEPEGKYLVDKLPLNLVHLDVIQYVFPDSRILMALRDPRDVVLSCYMQNFQLNEAMSSFLHMDSGADLYNEVMELWLEYRKKLALPWMEVVYERLISDFDNLAPEIFAFLDIPWEDSIREFHKAAGKRFITTPSYQGVGSPLYKSASGRWKRYQDIAGDTFEKLLPLVRQLGYEDN